MRMISVSPQQKSIPVRICALRGEKALIDVMLRGRVSASIERDLRAALSVIENELANLVAFQECVAQSEEDDEDGDAMTRASRFIK